MLPKQVTDLTDRYVRVFDSERPTEVEFRRAYDEAMEPSAREGKAGEDGIVIAIGNHLMSYVNERSRFIWKKLQEALALNRTDDYPQLGVDLKERVAFYFEPARQATEHYLEELRRSESAPVKSAADAKQSLESILLAINAEVDQFCARYTEARNRRIQLAASQTAASGSVRRPSNTEIRSRVAHEVSARQLFVDHNVRKHDITGTFIALVSFLLLGILIYVACVFYNRS